MAANFNQKDCPPCCQSSTPILGIPCPQCLNTYTPRSWLVTVTGLSGTASSPCSGVNNVIYTGPSEFILTQTDPAFPCFWSLDPYKAQGDISGECYPGLQSTPELGLYYFRLSKGIIRINSQNRQGMTLLMYFDAIVANDPNPPLTCHTFKLIWGGYTSDHTPWLGVYDYDCMTPKTFVITTTCYAGLTASMVPL